MIFSIAIIGLIFTAVIISSNISQPQPQQHITFKQGVEREQKYINERSYYLSQGCKPQTVENDKAHPNRHYVLTWNCPSGTETIQERAFTGNKTMDEICHEPKYNKTKAYTELCT
jgi:hypothetical protein